MPIYIQPWENYPTIPSAFDSLVKGQELFPLRGIR